VLYALPDGVTDYVWVRPYAGAGPRFVRQSLRAAAQPEGASVSETRLGFQLFGGAEVTFASLPGLAVSAGLHYGWLSNPSAGFELGGLGASVSGHWYVK
jgi:opacity protein-like surface antigen